MVEFIRMPALGQTTDDLVILNWFKQEGDDVQRGEKLLEVETDKATLEVESAAKGTLLRCLYKPGSTVSSGTVIAYIGQPDETLPDEPNNARSPFGAGSSRPLSRGLPPSRGASYYDDDDAERLEQREETGSGFRFGPRSGRDTNREGTGPGFRFGPRPGRDADRDQSDYFETPAGRLSQRLSAVDRSGYHRPNPDEDFRPESRPSFGASRIPAGPLAHKLAHQHGIDINTVTGTGPRGRVMVSDVQALIDQLSARKGKVLASPVARRLARDNDIDITRLQGSGPSGRITSDDVRQHIGPTRTTETATPRPETAPSSLAPARDFMRSLSQRPDSSAMTPASSRSITASQKRQTIASRLQRSIQSIPQINLRAVADMRAAQHLLSVQRAGGMADLTYTHLFLRAVGIALAANPELNALWIESQPPAIRHLSQASIGLAVATDDNLLVASITEPGSQTLTDLVRSTNEAIERIRRGALRTEDTRPVSLSISNLGMYNIDSFDAIIDPGQTAILAIGRVMDQVTVQGGGIHVVPQVHLTLSIDHRIADGAAAARLLDSIREAIENLQV